MGITRLKIENLSKQYRLGQVGTGTLSHDLNRLWAKIRGKEDPFSLVGVENDRTKKTKDQYVWALKDINFEVKEGEVVGIIGRNGAGKSTLLKILSKVTGPTQGTIKINGRIGALLEVGTGMHPELTGIENIYLNGAILGMTKKEIASKIDDIIEFSGIAKYTKTPFKRYSSGMRVRLGFAVAAFLEPEILIVDEVLAVGDAEFQKKAIGKMKDVSHGKGKAVLFVSHNMSSIRTLCTRSIVLDNGKIVFKGNTNEAIDYYLNSNNIINTQSLKNRTDRIGNGKLKFINVKTFRNNIECQEIISGDPLQIEVEYEINGSIEESRFLFSAIFFDKQEQRVLAFPSDEMNCSFDSINKRKKIILDIPSFALRGGFYNLKLLATEGGTRMENMLDNISNVASITVLPGDYWNVGKVNREGSMALLDGQIQNK